MEFDSFHVERPQKGNSLLAFPRDFILLDLETTGLSPQYDEIIEIACIRIKDLSIVDTFHTLVHPVYEIDEFITELTGITNEMVADAPPIENVLPEVLEYISSDIIVGHNVNFDINFLYDAFLEKMGSFFSNDFVDTMRLARKMLPDLPHHRLRDMLSYFGITPSGSHRAFCDCESTLSCYLRLLDIASASGDVNEYLKAFIKEKKKLDLRNITAETTDFNAQHPLFAKHCVFTGALEKMTRAQAAQLVVNLGGICDNGVTKKTNFLILGNNDYCKTIKDGKSSKQKKAEQYKLEGFDIEILPENVFYDLVLDS